MSSSPRPVSRGKERWSASRKADARRLRASGQSGRGGGRPKGPAQRPHTASRVRPSRSAPSQTKARPLEGRAVRPSPDADGFAALGIRADLDQALAASGVRSPFPIQAAAIPDALSGRDVLGRGQTGSGKTLAFGLPTLTRLADGPRSRSGRPRALVLLPTRELAVQVCDALTPLARSVRLRTLVVAGGLSYGPQLRSLDAGVDVLIATPGRLRDLLERGAVVLDEVEVTVLDEADHMADLGFLPDVTDILDRVPADGQRLLFSATLDKGVDRVVERYLTDPVTHSTDTPTAAVSTMAHHVLLVDPADKKRVMAEVASRAGRTIVFVRTKLGADRVAGQLRESGVLAAALHGGLTQSVRSRVLDAFRDGRLPVLVATDVAARGIHVDDVSLVLQADPPGDHKDYLHRSGRTARAGEHGIVATLALPHQRRSVERMTRTVDVDVTPVRVRPGRGELLTVGGREPTGEAVSEAALRAVVHPPRRARGGRPRGATSAARRSGGGWSGGGRSGEDRSRRDQRRHDRGDGRENGRDRRRRPRQSEGVGRTSRAQ